MKSKADEQYVVLKAAGNCAGIILDSSVVERSAVNRNVVGSSPTRGAKRTSHRYSAVGCFFVI